MHLPKSASADQCTHQVLRPWLGRMWGCFGMFGVLGFRISPVALAFKRGHWRGNLLGLAWMLGALLIICYALWGYLRTVRKLQAAYPDRRIVVYRFEFWMCCVAFLIQFAVTLSVVVQLILWELSGVTA